MSFVAFGYLSQFPLNQRLKNFEILTKEFYKLFLNIILISIIIFYIFFIRIPHCCDFKKNNINLYGGIVSKTIVEANSEHQISKIYLEFANKIKSTFKV